jgi:5-methylcytosine-specific restriction endonuclease McrA
MKVVGNRLKTVDTRTCKPPPKEVDNLYASMEWRQLVAAVIRARGRRCEECGKTHGADGAPIRIYGDHIKELRDGGAPLDPRNVQLLCGSCHGKKTHRERAKRMGLI